MVLQLSLPPQCKKNKTKKQKTNVKQPGLKGETLFDCKGHFLKKALENGFAKKKTCNGWTIICLG